MNPHRRRVLLASAALLAGPHATRAQQAGRRYVVGTLLRGGIAEKDVYTAALREHLASHGFVDGRNLHFEHGFFEGDGVGSGEQAARRLLALKVDAILSTFDAITEGALLATKSVPVVFAWVSNPLELRLVASLSRPGGNATGVSTRRTELTLKRYELALELVPDAKRIALLGDDRFWPQFKERLRPALVELAKKGNRELLYVPWNLGMTAEDASKAGAQVALTPSHLISWGYRHTIEAWVKTSIQRRLPIVYVGREEVEAGGLISYGTNILEDLRRAAQLLARVLKGENPGDLPVDQASRFELAVNLKTARAMDLTIPPSILLRADRVIE